MLSAKEKPPHVPRSKASAAGPGFAAATALSRSVASSNKSRTPAQARPAAAAHGLVRASATTTVMETADPVGALMERLGSTHLSMSGTPLDEQSSGYEMLESEEKQASLDDIDDFER
jgi:hypothetical protein